MRSQRFVRCENSRGCSTCRAYATSDAYYGYVGWEMTAIAAKVLKAKGAYRCPWENGFVYVVYSSLRFITEQSDAGSGSKKLECSTHGSGFETFVCEHLVSNPAQEWFSREPDDDHHWPDARREAVTFFFSKNQGNGNANNEAKTKIKLLCHHCYERLRLQEKVPDARP